MREMEIRAVWNRDAPPGKMWECPDCQSRASLGGNAGYHATKTGHGIPSLVSIERAAANERPLSLAQVYALYAHVLGEKFGLAIGWPDFKLPPRFQIDPMKDDTNAHSAASNPQREQRKHSHYFRNIGGVDVDFYLLCDIFEITEQPQAHALKKIMFAGRRPDEAKLKDIREAIDTLERWHELVSIRESAAKALVTIHADITGKPEAPESAETPPAYSGRYKAGDIFGDVPEPLRARLLEIVELVRTLHII